MRFSTQSLNGNSQLASVKILLFASSESGGFSFFLYMKNLSVFSQMILDLHNKFVLVVHGSVIITWDTGTAWIVLSQFTLLICPFNFKTNYARYNVYALGVHFLQSVAYTLSSAVVGPQCDSMQVCEFDLGQYKGIYSDTLFIFKDILCLLYLLTLSSCGFFSQWYVWR